MENSYNFRRFGTMIDCSRNAVMTVDSLKKWTDIISSLGYNTLLLYMEDTYEVDDNPYFGYKRGKYSGAELREIDEYARKKGVEVIPCIQTLAHLNELVGIPYYRDIVDCNDILLIGSQKVYDLIDNMFKSLSSCLTTKHINIGMDEAHMVGRGKYYDINGDVDRTKLIVEHLTRVAEIAKKYGFTVSMWSDMFFRLATNGNYYDANITVPDEIKSLIPDNVELVYWDYYSHDRRHYKAMLSAHEKIKKGTWFAGGFWTWSGFAPHNTFSVKATKAALPECKKAGVQDVFFTIWGDDTAECSKFAILPVMFFAAEFARGEKSMKRIKENFKKQFGISFDAFISLDLDRSGTLKNPAKYILYNDLFCGKLDSRIRPTTSEEFAAYARKLARYKKNGEWGYLFETLSALCKVVSIKADISFRLVPAYTKGDKNEIKAIIKDCRLLLRRMKELYTAFEAQWMRENKPHGFDVQDIRLGGMIVRTEHCIKRLQDFVDGKIDRIEELEEPILDYYGLGEERVYDYSELNSFKKTFTNNTLSW
ncbi:MAG: beta-N-acetylhexosaminidase [Clostridia bacterium]|nr:beta-N-acetylhexosaminidase [Clostridia bacterium]